MNKYANEDKIYLNLGRILGYTKDEYITKCVNEIRKELKGE